MTNDDKEALKEFLSSSGFVFGFVVFISILAFILNGAANWLEAQPVPSNQRFEVVDRYENRCDVVRYNPDSSARYFYMLDCSSK